jgi:hypothetical protein
VLRQGRRRDGADDEQCRDADGDERCPSAAGEGLLRRGRGGDGAAAGAAGAAETWTGGGGQVTAPSRVTVTARCTTSSSSIDEHAVLLRGEQRDEVQLFVPYSCDACCGRRPARSV